MDIKITVLLPLQWANSKKREEGTKASDSFSSIVQTAKKLVVSVYDYFNDRVNKSFKMPSLAEMIRTKCKT